MFGWFGRTLAFFDWLFTIHKIVDFLDWALVDKRPVWHPDHIFALNVENLVVIQTLIELVDDRCLKSIPAEIGVRLLRGIPVAQAARVYRDVLSIGFYHRKWVFRSLVFCLSPPLRIEAFLQEIVELVHFI